MKYIGKKALSINSSNLATIGADNRLIDTAISDAFRKVMGNYYLMQAGKKIWFQAIPPADMWARIMGPGNEQHSVPMVRMTKTYDLEGEYIHRVEVGYRANGSASTPGVEIPGGMQDVYDWLQDHSTFDVDGAAVEYDPSVTPGTQQTGFPKPGIAFEEPVPEIVVPQNAGAGVDGMMVEYEGGGGSVGVPTPRPEFGIVVPRPGVVVFTPNLTQPADVVVDVPHTEIPSAITPKVVVPDASTVSVLESIQRAVEATAGTFYDGTYVSERPYDADELMLVPLLNNPRTCNVVPSYNFYDKEYEAKFYEPSYPEIKIPNMYVVIGEANDTIGTTQYNDYILQNDGAFSSMGCVTFATNHLLDAIWLNDLAKQAQVFPAHVAIDLSTEVSEIVDAMKNAQIHNTFVVDYLRGINDDYAGFMDANYHIQEESTATDPETQSVTFTLADSDQRVKAFRLADWIALVVNTNDGLQQEFVRNNMTDITMLDVTGNQVEVLNGFSEIETSDIWSNYLAAMGLFDFQARLQRMIREYTRGYDQIYAGQQAHAETLLYTINKYEVATGRRVQTFLLLNDATETALRYIDTQVKYGKQYRYEIMTHQLVFGTRYWYENIQPYDPDRQTVVFDAHAKPDPLVLVMPYFAENTMVRDLSPAPPMISLVPYRDYQNKLTVLLAPGGAGRVRPVAFTEDEMGAFTRDADGLVACGNDDAIVEYELYRLSHAPRSFQEFMTGKKTIIPAKIFYDNNLFVEVSNIVFEDEIEPNENYYYIARARDVHGHLSPISAVHMVRLVAGGDRHIPLIRAFSTEQFEKAILAYRDKYRTMQRYIMIRPAYEQAVIDARSGDLENHQSVAELPVQVGKLGVRPSSPWGKQYRLRVRSKHSGRALDLLFTFKSALKDDAN